MAIQNQIVMLLSNPVLQEVFKEIVKNRSALFKELVTSLSNNTDLNLEDHQVAGALEQLKNADLIKEREAPIKDFNSYYITADGLTADRQLRLSEQRSPIA
jgi:hypothetical protein